MADAHARLQAVMTTPFGRPGAGPSNVLALLPYPPWNYLSNPTTRPFRAGLGAAQGVLRDMGPSPALFLGRMAQGDAHDTDRVSSTSQP
ncbi:hypothetical protein CSAL01_13423 [Colletotrichum salicis]|uniref:Uncharacterized protein n=1 Tax=Colletotrichum salicis TaxID=1209931 RepID=A0A135TY15_9PEZI|nr:hypothetical protein CSAL01_13423 [Colletotrichum salicis]